ncbi:hypothetical protein J8F10_31705 [Gemmata sp. G18]|uniref:Uncharacterized protein n=1 Tax=Gemmata palustris TaxID=2822762 RepID=A0ABS5C1G8_9BACT|nr:hypothetical protein [Gemmata palustris]MBP3959837.1 hypothetical protein [Gemmata palustris]
MTEAEWLTADLSNLYARAPIGTANRVTASEVSLVRLRLLSPDLVQVE